MTTSEDATMAETGDPKLQFKLVHHTKKAKKPKEAIAMEGEAKITIHYPMRILMTANGHGTKSSYKSMHNPIPKGENSDVDDGCTQPQTHCDHHRQ